MRFLDAAVLVVSASAMKSVDVDLTCCPTRFRSVVVLLFSGVLERTHTFHQIFHENFQSADVIPIIENSVAFMGESGAMLTPTCFYHLLICSIYILRMLYWRKLEVSQISVYLVHNPECASLSPSWMIYNEYLSSLSVFKQNQRDMWRWCMATF